MEPSINSTDFFYEKTHGSIAFFNVKLFFNAVTQSRSRFVIHFVQQQGTPLPYDIANAETFIKFYLSYLNDSLGGSMYDDAVRNIIDLDQRIYNILLPSPPDIENGDPNMSLLNESNIYTFERLRALWPGFDWEGFINYMYNNLSGLEVPQDLEIVVTTPAYFERLGPLLQNTSQEVIRDYATFWFVYKNLQNLYPEASNVNTCPRDLERLNLGNHECCMRYVQDTLPLALARPYVMNIFPEETREKVEMMVDYLRKSFGERINQMDWLSDFSKRSSIEKLSAITAYSAYPAEIYDADYVNGFYSNFHAFSKDYFGNRLRQYELNLRLELSLTHGYNKTAWPYFGVPTEANAGYLPIINLIVISAGIATEPLYSADWPDSDYQLFGGLGVIVGHEITHGFDNEGQQYDKDGIRQMMWSNKSQDEFNNRKQCFIDQYNQYNVSGYKVNGDRTLPENIADTGGLLTSFRAYRMRAETTPQLKLPTLPYTPEQLFFIAFGQTWCESAYNPSYYDQFLGGGVHAPNPARVRTVANSPEFAEAFNCPAGTAMNPTNKCTIW